MSRAKLFVGDRLARGRVVLERDQRRPRDRYGRTLALVKVDGVDLGARHVCRADGGRPGAALGWQKKALVLK